LSFRREEKSLAVPIKISPLVEMTKAQIVKVPSINYKNNVKFFLHVVYDIKQMLKYEKYKSYQYVNSERSERRVRPTHIFCQCNYTRQSGA